MGVTPRDPGPALRLSGKEHSVITGVAIIIRLHGAGGQATSRMGWGPWARSGVNLSVRMTPPNWVGQGSPCPPADPDLAHVGPTQEVLDFHEETRVRFSPLSDDLVREHVESDEPW